MDAWPQPNDLSLDPAQERAEDRLAAFFEVVDALPPWQLGLLATRALDEAYHAAAVDRARAEVTRVGRDELLARAQESIRTGLARRLSANAYPAYGVIALTDQTRPIDRVRLERTLSDAALGLVVEDVIDGATLDELLGPCADLVEADLKR